MNKQKIINDPVYGFIHVPSALVFDIISHPYFQRLRRIKQMGLADYVYPGATHSRFHHALGAMHLMSTALDILKSKGVAISQEEHEAACAALLLHDIGHGIIVMVLLAALSIPLPFLPLLLVATIGSAVAALTLDAVAARRLAGFEDAAHDLNYATKWHTS